MNFNDVVDLNIVYNQLKALYPTAKITKTDINIANIAEMLEDEYLLTLALEREKNDTGVTYSFEEVLAERGLTPGDIDRMLEEEDVELE